MAEKSIFLTTTHSDIIAALMRCRGTRLFWSNCSYKDLFVPHRAIVGTLHPDYMHYYSEEDGSFEFGEGYPDKNGFPGKRGDPGKGWRDGWDRPPSRDHQISLIKHPAADRYIIDGQGNHRVMKSKIMDGPDVFASVCHTEWKPLINTLLKSLPQNAIYMRVLIPDAYSAYVKIREHRGCRSFHHVFHAEESDTNTTLFYLRMALARIPRFRPGLLLIWFTAFRFAAWCRSSESSHESERAAWVGRFLAKYTP